VPELMLIGRTSPATRDAIVALLRRDGYTVREARDLRHAMESDVVLADDVDAARALEARSIALDGVDCVAEDPRTRELFARVRRVAQADSAVLVTGETGTGKELVARQLFHGSPRHGSSGKGAGRFVPVNCAGLSDTLLESELFGHIKGAFTGAVADKPGLVEEAEGGILFLDEIGDMPLALQVRLLRFLDSGEVRRVGDTRLRRAHVRIVAATNRPLDRDVAAGRFRSDLFYRLNVLSLHVPPLRERPEDIPVLASRALARSAARLGLGVRAFSADASAALRQYRWPGNVRQLHSAIESAVLSATGDLIEEADLPSCVQRDAARSGERAVADADACVDSDGRARSGSRLIAGSGSGPADAERLVRALVRTGGNQTHAAAALGISRTTLWRRLRRASDIADRGDVTTEALTEM
jgi:DNA-binding NtrC family response regulator